MARTIAEAAVQCDGLAYRQCLITSLDRCKVHIWLLTALCSVSLNLLRKSKRSKLKWMPLYSECYMTIMVAVLFIMQFSCLKFGVHFA